MAVDAKSINIHMQVTGPFPAQMAAAGASVQTFGNQAHAGMAKAQTGMARFGGVASKVGATAAIGLAIGLGLSAKAAIDFESSFTGVRKTVETSEAGFQRLAMGVRQMAKEIPIGVNELNRIMELGGQLGVGPNNLLEFTETIAALGVTTTLSTEAAATGLARIDNVMGKGTTSFGEMGAIIVELGNNFAATEDEILTFATRIAPIGATLGVTTDEIFAIATAFTSVGIPAERGGTAVQKTFIKIAEAAALGGKELDTFSSVAGLTAEQFANLVKMNPNEALRLFINGLGDLEEQGINTFGVLDAVDLSNQRVIASLLGLASAEGVYDDAIETAKKAREEEVALTEEAGKRYGTTASQLILLKNGLVDVGIGIGQEVLPAINDFILGLQTVGEWLGSVPVLLKQVVAGAVALAGAFWAFNKHPYIASLALIVGWIAAIGRNAARSQERVEELQTVLDRGFSDVLNENQLITLIGEVELEALETEGFSLVDIDKAITGTQADFDMFFAQAEAMWLAGLDVSEFAAANAGDLGVFAFMSNEGEVQSGIDMIIKARGALALLREEQRVAEGDANKLRRFGLGHLVPGDDELQTSLAKRKKYWEDVIAFRLGIESETEGEFYEPRAVLNAEVFGIATELLGEYALSVQKSFDETQAARFAELDGWYEFDKEFEVAFDKVLATSRRISAASIGFEDLLFDLDLAPDVEAMIRQWYGGSPTAKEGFLNADPELRQSFIDGFVADAEFLRAEFARQWARDTLPDIEEVGVAKFITALLEEGTQAVIDDQGEHGNAADVWLGFLQASLDSAPTQALHSLLMGIFNDPVFLASLGVTEGRIAGMIEYINGLEFDPLVVEIIFNVDDFPQFPGWNPNKPNGGLISVVDEDPYGPENYGAFGGNIPGRQPIMVGEYGPELFVPFSNGNLISNDKLGGGGETNYNLTINGSEDVVDDGRVTLLTAQMLGSI